MFSFHRPLIPSEAGARARACCCLHPSEAPSTTRPSGGRTAAGGGGRSWRHRHDAAPQRAAQMGDRTGAAARSRRHGAAARGRERGSTGLWRGGGAATCRSQLDLRSADARPGRRACLSGRPPVRTSPTSRGGPVQTCAPPRDWTPGALALSHAGCTTMTTITTTTITPPPFPSFSTAMGPSSAERSAVCFRTLRARDANSRLHFVSATFSAAGLTFTSSRHLLLPPSESSSRRVSCTHDDGQQAVLEPCLSCCWGPHPPIPHSHTRAQLASVFSKRRSTRRGTQPCQPRRSRTGLSLSLPYCFGRGCVNYAAAVRPPRLQVMKGCC